MAQSALIRGSIAVAAACAIVSATGWITAPPARADASSEAVISAAPRYRPPQDTVALAGPSGFLHKHEGQSAWVWTMYSGGPDTPMPGRYSPAPGYSGAGSDVVATKTTTGIQLQDMDAGTTTTIVPPSGQNYLGTFGSNVVTWVKASDGTIASLHILAASSGQQTDTQVTGWPVGITSGVWPMAGDANSLVVKYNDSTGTRLGLIDLATGQLTQIAGTVDSTADVVLTDTYLAWYLPDVSWAPLHVLRRSDLTAAETTIQVPWSSSSGEVAVGQFGIVGNYVLYTYGMAPGTSPADDQLGGPLYAMPLTGGTPTLLLDHADLRTVSPYPGGAVVVGGSSLSDWAASQVTIGADGTPALTAIDSDPPMPSPITGVSLAGGQLLTVELSSATGGNTFTRSIQLGNPPSYGPRSSFNSPQNTHCTYPTCGPLGTGDGRFAQLANSGASIQVSGPTGSTFVVPGVSGGTLIDSDGRYVIYDNSSTGKQYIGDTTLNTGSNVAFTRPITAAALSGETLWSADSTTGSISSVDLATRQTTRTVTIGAPCVPSELQASAGRWIYWSCGTTGPAGVYDLATGTDIPVPSGPSELGDGFVVEHDMAAGKLVLTDVHTGTAATSDLAALPALSWSPTDDRQLTWSVDKYAGGIAYVDAQQNVHIVDPHLPASPASGYRMLSGQRLDPGDTLTSGSMRLVMQSDGNLVAYLKAGGGTTPEWATGTWGHPGAYAVMQSDGNLVVYSQGGGPGIGGALWSSHTYGNPGAYATLQDDGNLVIYRQGTNNPGNALWASSSYARSQTISPGEVMKPDWWTQGQYTFLVMQPDGNLVMYRKRDGAAIWSSRTWGNRGAYAIMQKDGNLVVYRQGGGPGIGGALWATGTWGHPGAYAIMQNDGNLVIYRQGGGPTTGGALWATGTWKTAP